MSEINIQGVNKAALLAGLYNAATTTRDGIDWHPGGMSHAAAKSILGTRGGLAARSCEMAFLTIFNIKGRNIKIDLTGDELDSEFYDRYYGEGAAAAVVAKLREGAE